MRLIRLCLLALLLVSITLVGHAQEDGIRAIRGTIDNSTTFIEIPVTIEEDGQALTIDIRAISGDLDPVLYLVDETGKIIAQNDDRGNDSKDSLIVFPAVPAGDYTIVATRYNVEQGRSNGEFELTINIGDTLDLASNRAYDVSPEALSAAGFPEIEIQPRANWTILAFYGGDTDLERGILNDFNEFELAGGSTEDVRIIALLDRAPGYTDIDDDWQNARLYEVEPDISGDEDVNFPPTPDTIPLAEMPELDMGDGETLAQFLVWGMRHYPAQRYAIAFASHGAGWQGLIVDETDHHDIITLPELDQAFAIATESAQLSQLDLLINDACLMSSVEYHTVTQNYFRMSYASPEVVVDPALDMTIFTEALQADPDIDLAFLGTTLMDVYIERDTVNRVPALANYMTNAITDLTVFPTVTEAVAAFSALVSSDTEAYAVPLGEARANAYTYSQSFDQNASDYIDLGSLMEQLLVSSNDDALTEAAQTILGALNNSRLYANGGASVQGRISYYNIYFPADSSDFDPQYFVESPLDEWGLMLTNYYAVVTPQSWERSDEPVLHAPTVPVVGLSRVYPDVGNINHPFNIQTEVIARNAAEGTFIVNRVLDDGHLTRLYVAPMALAVQTIDGNLALGNYWDSGIDVASHTWDAMLPVISDDKTTRNEFITVSESVGGLEGRYREVGSEIWNDVMVVFDLESGSVQGVFGRAPETGALASVQIADGSEFQSYRQFVTRDGTTLREAATIYQWGDLQLSFAPAPDGDYQVGIQIATYNGAVGQNVLPVMVDNTDIDTSLAGFNDTTFGFEIALPASWSNMTYQRESNYFIASNPTQSEHIVVVPMDTTTGRVGTFTQVFLEESIFGGEADASPLMTELAGEQAFEFDFASTWRDAHWQGRAISVYNPFTHAELVFIVYSLPSSESAASTFEMLRDSISLLRVGAQRSWMYAAAGVEGLFEIPVQVDWNVEAWRLGTVYRLPTDVVGVQPFVSVATLPINQLTSAPRPIAGVYGNAYQQTGNDEYALLLRDRLVDEYLSVSVSDLVLTENEIYYGEYNTWDVTLYTAVRDGVDVIGRIYATTFTTVRGYRAVAIWVETPVEQEQLLYTVFEPMIEGFKFYNAMTSAAAFNPGQLPRPTIDTGTSDPDGSIDGIVNSAVMTSLVMPDCTDIDLPSGLGEAVVVCDE